MSQLFGHSILSPIELFQAWSSPAQAMAKPASQTLVPKQPNITIQDQIISTQHHKPARSSSMLSFVSPLPEVPQLNLPARSIQAKTGSEFWTSVKTLNRPDREKAIQAEILSGNIPDHLRSFKALELKTQDQTGKEITATAYVSPDYLAIGSNDDYVLVPMSPITAQAIADQTGTSLPTRKIADQIYQQAEIKLSPKPQKPGSEMMSTAYYQRHDQSIQKQRFAANAQPGQLIAGHKKDVVISNRLNHKPKSVAIYGWHQPNGKNIQPLSTIHENTYADYSHGVRLLAPEIHIGKERYSTVDSLKSPVFSKLLSDEGPILNPRATRQ